MIDVAAEVERLLRRSGLVSVRVGNVEMLTASHTVARCYLDFGNRTSVIFKQYGPAFDPSNLKTRAARGFLRDWAGHLFLSAACGQECGVPELIAGDLARGCLILEDLHGLPDLETILSGPDPHRATEALLAYSETLAHMHGLSAPLCSWFEDINRCLGNQHPQQRFFESVDLTDPHEKVTVQLQNVVSNLNLDLSDHCRREIAFIAETLRSPLRACYCHGDPSSLNCLLAGQKARLIDFEFGGFRHPLTDLAYIYSGHPTGRVQGQVPLEVLQQMETAYRVQLGEYGRILNYDRYNAEFACACGFWMLENLAALLPRCLVNEPQKQPALVRERVLMSCEGFLKISNRTSSLPALSDLINQVKATLEKRWNGPITSLLYPAFRTTPKAQGGTMD